MEYVIVVIIAIYLSGIFLNIGKPKSLKQVKAVQDREEENDQRNKRRKKKWWKKLEIKYKDDLQAHQEYIASHQSFVKVIYITHKYTKTKTGFKIAIAYYIINSDNYYDISFGGKFECPVNVVEGQIKERLSKRYQNRKIVITKL